MSATTPGAPPRRRSTKIMLASSVLCLEAFVAFFATLAVFGLRGAGQIPVGQIPAGVILGVGIALSAALIVACAFLRRPWGIGLGWVLQLLLIAVGFFEPTMFVIGALFALSWWYALRLGRRIDTENVRRDAAQKQWEAEHGSSN